MRAGADRFPRDRCRSRGAPGRSGPGGVTGWLRQCAADSELSGSARVRVPRHTVERFLRRAGVRRRHPRRRQRRLRRARCAPPSWACPSPWSRRTRSAAPACTAAASRPRRCCTPPRSPTTPARASSSACARSLEGIDMTGGQRVQGRRRRPALQGPAGPGEDPQDHRRRGRRPARRAPTPSRSAARRLQRPQRRAGHRLVLAHAARPRDRRPRSSPATTRSPSTTCPSRVVVLGGGVIGVEFASVWKSFGAEVTIVEALPHLVAARGRGAAPRRSSAPSASAASTSSRRAVRRRRADRRRRHASRLEDGETIEAELLLVAVGRGPVPPASATRRPASRWTAASSSPTSGCGPTCRTSTRSATSCPACSSRTAASQQGIFVAEQIAGLEPGADRRRRHPAGHLLRPRGRLRRAHRGAGQGAVRRRRGRDATSTTSAATARARSSRPPASSSSSGRRTARSSASTWSAPGRRAGRRGPADRQLGGLPRGGRAARPRPPDPDRGARRGAPRAGRQAAARALTVRARTRN